DFVAIGRHPDLRVLIKLVGWDARAIARALPESRSLFLLRHPCGQVASILNGAAQLRFDPRGMGAGTPFDEEKGAAAAATPGVDGATFRALPDAAKHAWAWVAFNETALEGLEGRHNVRIVVYEDLCRRPMEVARDLFAFTGLGWGAQTEAF